MAVQRAFSCTQNMLVLVFISDTHEWGHIDVVKSAFWNLVLEIPIFGKEVYWPLTFKDEKTNFHPYFAFGQASFLLLIPERRTGWLFYDAQEHPHVEAQALRMSITRLLRSIKITRVKISFKIWTRSDLGSRMHQRSMFCFANTPLIMNFDVKSQPDWTSTHQHST
jgi:hypothetical protein